MSRCVVLVDAGYLLGAATTILARDLTRAALVVDYPRLLSAIGAEAAGQTGQPLLRVLWYDAAYDARPRAEHQAISLLPDVKLRLGVLVRHGGRVQQKGVDSFLQRDLTTLARNGAASDIVLIGGDEDLRRGVDEAQDYGVKVHLWGVEAAAVEFNQSRTLVAEADRRWVMPAEWLAQYVSVRPETLDDRAEQPSEAVAPAVPTPTAALVELASSTAPAGEAGVVEGESTASPEGPVEEQRAPTPADLAQFARPARPAEDGGLASRPQLDFDPRVPHLRDLSDGRQQWQDNEDDMTAGPLTPQEVGRRYGERWASRATPEQLAALLESQPKLPRHIDGELLRYANALDVDTWDDWQAKYAVRSAAVAALERAADGTPRGDAPQRQNDAAENPAPDGIAARTPGA